MALQGTLETFALGDVLRLLASTKKTGVLRLEGDRGSGQMAVVDGELADGSASGAPLAQRPAEVLFELLRYADGSFVFDASADAGELGTVRENVDEALADAEEQLREWRDIEAVVPSPTRLVSLVADRDDAITLTAAQWSAVVALGDGCSTLDLGERLELPELPATRLVRDLIEMGAAEIGDEAPLAAAAPAAAPVAEPEPAPAPITRAEPEPAPAPPPPAPVVELEPEPTPAPPPPEPAAPSFAAGSSSFADAPSLIGDPDPEAIDRPAFAPEPPSSNGAFAPAPAAGNSAFAPPAEAPRAEDPIAGWNDDPDDGLSGFHDDADDDPVPLFGRAEAAPGPDDPFGPDPFQIPSFRSPGEAQEADDAAEMARQLANLSPRAQQAVAAAAAADSDEERNQAIDQAQQASDQPLNRDLLLKYLSSVDE